MLETDRFFFVRPQRTASTTLRLRMARHFGEAAIYPDPSDRRRGDWYGAAAASVDRLRERMAVRGDEVRVVAGHFPLSVASLIACDFRTFTVLRDPVERTLSRLRQRGRRLVRTYARWRKSTIARPSFEGSGDRITSPRCYR
jgi:hypothetical protein